MAVYEEERRRVERNMLALSNLNLATSSFVGRRDQKMLAQALDRVLNVVRIPAGALCLHTARADGPTSVIVAGLGDSFCSRGSGRRISTNTVSNLVAASAGWLCFAIWRAMRIGKRSKRKNPSARCASCCSRKACDRGGHQPAGQRARLRGAAARDAGQPQLHSRGAPAAARAGPADRHGRREQLPDPADLAPQRRAAHPQRNWPRAQLDSRSRYAARTDLLRNAPRARRRQLLHRLL